MTAAKRIGKYPVVRQLGKGAMGNVYEAFDPETGAKVAIKILRAEHLADSRADSASARFEREAQAGGRLQHPNIVAVHEYGEQGRIKFIVMEFVDGQELRELMMEHGRFEVGDAAAIMLQLLDALDCSHQHGIVHRDIKPSNVMITHDMRVKVMDFGIARIENAAFTQVGTLLGTPSHMAPEQMRGESADGRADLWAAGVLLYEMLTGRCPFRAKTPVALMQEVLGSEPLPLSALAPHIPPALDFVMQQALAKPRERRFQTASSFSLALQHAARVWADSPASLDLDLASAPATAPEPFRSTDPPREPAPDWSDGGATVILPIAAPSPPSRSAGLADPYAAPIAAPMRPPASTSAQAAPSAVPISRAPATFDAQTLMRAELRLAEHVGPLARMLTRMAASESSSVDELYHKLAGHIDSVLQRREFLDALR